MTYSYAIVNEVVLSLGRVEDTAWFPLLVPLWPSDAHWSEVEDSRIGLGLPSVEVLSPVSELSTRTVKNAATLRVMGLGPGSCGDEICVMAE